MSGKSNETYVDVPGGWVKRIVQRTSGTSVGKWDVYLKAPDGTKIRSNAELTTYVLKMYGKISDHFDPYIINMDRPPEVEGGLAKGTYSSSTQRLANMVEYLKAGRSPDDISEILASKPKKPKATTGPALPNKNNNNVGFRRRKRNVGRPRIIRPVLTKESRRIAEHRPAINRENVIQLEKHFLANVCVPGPEQIQKWATELKLDYVDVSMWFRNKWKGKLEYQAMVAMEREEAADVTRQLRKFDVYVAYEDTIVDDDNYVIEHENAEEDS